MNDLEQKDDDQFWSIWNSYITAAGRIKKEIDKRQRPTPAKESRQRRSVKKCTMTPAKEAKKWRMNTP